VSGSRLFIKRSFDLIASLFGLLLFLPLILIAWLLSTLELKENGFFVQTRIGRYGKPFKLVKIKSMRTLSGMSSTVTSSGDPRITRTGAFFRRTKIDELPQLFNVLIGDMSFVGPRPDVPGYADLLMGEDRKILQIRPGITGPAQLYFKNEEELLAKQSDPIHFNDTVIWPRKVDINKNYVDNFCLSQDIKYIIQTII
jgi:lipopolysaccharide/colanic/teichoic acid biosynthesis glycosyltransferase